MDMPTLLGQGGKKDFMVDEFQLFAYFRNPAFRVKRLGRIEAALIDQPSKCMGYAAKNIRAVKHTTRRSLAHLPRRIGRPV